jgi:tripartite-type tricarboxylate transporter receptor subunit TctC
MIFRLAVLAAASAVIALAQPALAQDPSAWPAKPVNVVVSTPPGSQQDAIGRLLADGLRKIFNNQPFIVVNVPGAGSIASADKVHNSAADGYTLLVANAAPMGIASGLRRDLTYDPAKDFTPVGQLTASFFLVVTNPKNIQAKTLPELLQMLKAAPEKYNYATSGIGGMVHMQNELFMLRTGTKMTHIPYKSSGEVTTALLAGFVDLSVNTTDALSQVKEGKLTALAVTADKRLAELPDVPTIKEFLPNYGNAAVWQGVFVRTGTSQVIVDKLNKGINEFLTTPEVAARLTTMGLTPVPTTQQQFAALVKEDATTWAEVITTNGIKPE